MKKEFKRLLSILLVLTLLGSTLPMSVSASALPTQNASAIENHNQPMHHKMILKRMHKL